MPIDISNFNIPDGNESGAAAVAVETTRATAAEAAITAAAGTVPVNTAVTAPTSVVTNKLLGADANPAFKVGGDGKLSWGAGGASATDVALARIGATTLQLTGVLQTNAWIYMNTGLASQVLAGYDGVNAAIAPAISFGLGGGTGDTNLKRVSAAYLATDGDLGVTLVGKGLRVKEGANAKQGTATLVAGSSVVANTSITATSRVFLTSQADGGTPGFLRVSARTAGTSFTITSSNAADTSTVAYEIFETG